MEEIIKYNDGEIQDHFNFIKPWRQKQRDPQNVNVCVSPCLKSPTVCVLPDVYVVSNQRKKAAESV